MVRTPLTLLFAALSAVIVAAPVASHAAPGMVQFYRFDCNPNHSALSGINGWIKRYSADDWSSGINGNCRPKTSDPSPINWGADSPGSNFLRQSNQTTVGDYDIETTLRLNGNTPAGLVFGWQDDQNYWVTFLVSHSGGGTYPLPNGTNASTSGSFGSRGVYLYRVVNGVASAIGTQGLGNNPSQTDDFTLLVTRRSGLLTVSVNGSGIKAAPETAPTGGFGFWAYDNDVTTFDYLLARGFDADGDGVPPEGGDCDDTDPTVSPNRPEVCDGVDNNCDGVTDGPTATDATPWYNDNDGDGFGDPAVSEVDCDAPQGFVADNTDCNDFDDLTYPGAPEICNGLDNDCDTIADSPAPDDAPQWYRDADNDGFGNLSDALIACEQPFGYVADSTDCDDTNNAVNPSAPEVCDGADTNCDGAIDAPAPAGAPTWYLDADGDTFGGTTQVNACAAPPGYVAITGDCADDDPAVNPAAIEICDGIDNDCDGTIDGPNATGNLTWYRDADADGYGDPLISLVQCEQPDGYVNNAGDCNDAEPLAYSGADEVCDGVDNDCNGVIDGPNALNAVTWYRDADDDGYGDPAVSVRQCQAPDGFVDNADDCNDTQPLAYTGADELCDGVDNNCDGTIDGPGALDATSWYLDLDGDGFGDPDTEVRSCVPIPGRVPNDGDCDDTDPNAWTDAVEQCDGLDNNCNGEIDEHVVDQLFYADLDRDGFGDPNNTILGCIRPDGYVGNAFDCNDNEPLAYDFAPEVCGDGVDNDCNGFIDEAEAIDATRWYYDLDGDGYGDVTDSILACEQPPLTSAIPGDCDDTNPLTSPGADEVCDGIDNNCDGTIDGPGAVDAIEQWPDLDGDGFGDASADAIVDCLIDDLVDNNLDCDDTDASINPDATEIPDNGIDEDCSGADTVTEPDDTDEPPVRPGDGPSVDEPSIGSGCGCAKAGSLPASTTLGLLVLGAALSRRRRTNAREAA